MATSTIYRGLDVHKDFITIAVLPAGSSSRSIAHMRLYGRMNRRVDAQVGYGRIVRSLDEHHALRFVERQPVWRGRRDIRIVAHLDACGSG